MVAVTVYSSPPTVIVGVTVGVGVAVCGTTTVAVVVVQLPEFSFSQIRYTMV